jgi:hypothetical protein
MIRDPSLSLYREIAKNGAASLSGQWLRRRD